MNTHYHLLVRTPRGDIAAGMQRFNWCYARTFNRLIGGFGHAFAARYGSVVVESEQQLLDATRYIVLNPVRAGLCALPGEWTWSSYAPGPTGARAFTDTRALLQLFGDSRAAAEISFRTFVHEGIAQPSPPYVLDARVP